MANTPIELIPRRIALKKKYLQILKEDFEIRTAIVLHEIAEFERQLAEEEKDNEHLA